MKMKQTKKNLDIDRVIVFSHLREGWPVHSQVSERVIFLVHYELINLTRVFNIFVHTLSRRSQKR